MTYCICKIIVGAKRTTKRMKKEKFMNNPIYTEDVIGTLKLLCNKIDPESERWTGVCMLASELLGISEDTILKILSEDAN